MYPENSTVPFADAYITVPFGAAISNPLWFVLPIPPGDERLPNLDVIVPETGFTVNLIPLALLTFVIFTAFDEAVAAAAIFACFAFANFISSDFFSDFIIVAIVFFAFFVLTVAISS